MKNAQTGLKSSRPLDRADYLQTGTNPERDEYSYENDFSYEICQTRGQTVKRLFRQKQLHHTGDHMKG